MDAKHTSTKKTSIIINHMLKQINRILDCDWSTGVVSCCIPTALTEVQLHVLGLKMYRFYSNRLNDESGDDVVYKI